jgi:hypothetical protein
MYFAGAKILEVFESLATAAATDPRTHGDHADLGDRR